MPPTEDPIGFGAGDSNLYGYVFADPVNASDPSGLACYEDKVVDGVPLGGRQPAGESIGPCTPTLGTRIGDWLDSISPTPSWAPIGPGSSTTVGEFRAFGILQFLGGLWELGAAATIDTAAVRFTQSSVSGSFSDGRTLQSTIDALRGPGGESVAGAIRPIRVFEQDGVLYTLDNRRLLAFSEAGRSVPYVWATPDEIAGEAFKFTATPEQLGGWFIRVKPPRN